MPKCYRIIVGDREHYDSPVHTEIEARQIALRQIASCPEDPCDMFESDCRDLAIRIWEIPLDRDTVHHGISNKVNANPHNLVVEYQVGADHKGGMWNTTYDRGVLQQQTLCLSSIQSHLHQIKLEAEKLDPIKSGSDDFTVDTEDFEIAIRDLDQVVRNYRSALKERLGIEGPRPTKDRVLVLREKMSRP